jgi:hypothetical protein
VVVVVVVVGGGEGGLPDNRGRQYILGWKQIEVNSPDL